MNIDISEAKGMLLDYAEEAKQSKSAANEIVEEVLRELGYSKRDKGNVQKLFNKQLDWLVRSKGVVTGVQVNKLGTDLRGALTEGLIGQSILMDVNILIVTDSQIYDVFRYINSADKKEFIKVDSIDIADQTDKNSRILNAISFDGIDLTEIDKILSEGSITDAETMELISLYINKNRENITKFVCEQKPACPDNIINESIDKCVRSIVTANMTPSDIKVRYEQAEKKYIDTISSRDTEIYELKKQIVALEDTNLEIQRELDVLSKKDYKHAVETIEFIAKNSGDNTKRFISYINDEIYTSSKLHKFVGELLQRLYVLKSVEAHAFIFDGEYFRLNSSNAKHNDMVIRNTVYDIMINDDEAEDALIRLRAIYNHFPDIVFACMETGFGNTKHNTGISDNLLEQDDEYDSYDSDDELEIISSDTVVKDTYSSTVDNTTADNNIATESSDDTEEIDGIKEPENFENISVEIDDIESCTDIEEIDDNNSEDTSGTTGEIVEEGNTLDTSTNPRELILAHISNLEYCETRGFEALDNIDVPEYSLIDIDTGIYEDLNSISAEPNENTDEINDTTTEETTTTTVSEEIGLNFNVIENADDTIDSQDDDIEEIDDTDNVQDEGSNVAHVINLCKTGQDTEEQYSDDIEELDDIDETFGLDKTEATAGTVSGDSEEIADSSNENIQDTDYDGSAKDCIDTSIDESSEDTGYVESEHYKNNETASEPIIIVTALSAANSLVSDYVEDIEFNNIEAITAEEVAFDVNSNYEDLTYDELLVKSLNAVLAIDIYSDLESKVITKLKHKRLDEISDFIQVRSADLAEFPSIAGTKYAVCGIENLSDLVYTLTRICQAIDIDIDKVYMFMTITTNSDIIRDNYGTTFESIQFRHTDEEYRPGENENTTISLIRGELFNNLLVTGNSIKAYADIFKRVLGVKTSYMELNIDGSKYTSLDAISYMIREAEKRNIDFESIRFGSAFGNNHKLISFDPDEVGDNPCEIELYSGEFIYCASLTEWQAVVSIIRVHNVLFKNSPIVIKTQVDMDAINFYGSAYDTEIATDSLAICGLAHYVRTHFPK